MRLWIGTHRRYILIIIVHSYILFEISTAEQTSSYYRCDLRYHIIRSREMASSALVSHTIEPVTSEWASALEQLQRVLGFFQGYGLLVVLSTGVLGNALSFVIFMRTRHRADAAVQYLSCLAVSDTGYILVSSVVQWLVQGLPMITNGAHSLNLVIYSRISCKIIAFCILLSQFISAWIIVAFSSERTFIVWFPLQRVKITSRMRSYLIFGINIACLCASVHRLFLIDIINDIGIVNCMYVRGESGQTAAIVFQLDAVLYNYLPCALIFVANISTLLGIFRSRRKIDGKKSKMVVKGDSKVIASLMLVSSLYVIFLTPPVAFKAYWDGHMQSKNQDPMYIQFIFYVANMMNQVSVINYCCNFIVYGCTMPFYRQEAKILFLSVCRQPQTWTKELGGKFRSSVGRVTDMTDQE